MNLLLDTHILLWFLASIKVKKIYIYMLKIIAVVALVILAAAVRLYPLQSLQSTLVWVTFYPVVMISAVIVGIYGGLLAITLSCLIALYGWSFIVSAPFINTHGDWIGLCVFIFNGLMMSTVAEAMKRANYRAKEAKKRAELANMAKSAFLATMSHELRTPLNAILGFSNIMLNDPSATKAQHDNLYIINRSGDHLLNLIDDVLDMAKIEAGKITYESSAIHLTNLLNNMVSMMKIRAIEKDIQLLVEFSKDLPVFVKTDSNKLRQIIVNLLGNAIKFTSHGGVSFRVEFESKNKHWLIICVEDSGIGISKDDINHIFEPFVQVGVAHTTQKGTGLGLSLVKEYTKIMRGEVSVSSKLGEGSVFRLKIPIELTEEHEALLITQKHGKVLGLEKDQPNYRILIVEDQKENWILLNTLLENVGFTVVIAKNGQEGVDVFKTFKPHFIFMDRRMPVMDGIKATIAIRQLKNGNDVKIVAVSASAFIDQRAEMIEIGMDDFIRKPYRPSEIYDVLEKHLGVRFIYEQFSATTSENESRSKILPNDFLCLPSSLRQNFAQSLLSGDTETISNLLAEIENINPQLSKNITSHIDNFNYSIILEILETLENKNES